MQHLRLCTQRKGIQGTHRGGFRTGQAGQLSRGLHNKGGGGPPDMSCHLLFFGILG